MRERLRTVTEALRDAVLHFKAGDIPESETISVWSAIVEDLERQYPHTLTPDRQDLCPNCTDGIARGKAVFDGKKRGYSFKCSCNNGILNKEA